MIRKKQHKIKLIGRVLGGGAAKTHQSKDVIYYTGDLEVGLETQNNYFRVGEFPTYVMLATPKGQYKIPFNEMLQLFKGEANGIKIHITLKPISGKLIYWA